MTSQDFTVFFIRRNCVYNFENYFASSANNYIPKANTCKRVYVVLILGFLDH